MSDKTSKLVERIREKQQQAAHESAMLAVSVAIQGLVPNAFDNGPCKARFVRERGHHRFGPGLRSDYFFTVTCSNGKETTFPGEDVPDIIWKKCEDKEIRNVIKREGE